MTQKQEQHAKQIDTICNKINELRKIVFEIKGMFNFCQLDGYNENLHELENEVFNTTLNSIDRDITLLRKVLQSKYSEIHDITKEGKS